jgi:hypothetical protein
VRLLSVIAQLLLTACRCSRAWLLLIVTLLPFIAGCASIPAFSLSCTVAIHCRAIAAHRWLC